MNELTAISPTWDSIKADIIRRWNVDFLFPHQQLCIHHFLSACAVLPDENPGEFNKGMLVSLPTGSGKSLCFMAPAAYLDGVCMILYPLNALLRDQMRRFEISGITARCYYGGMDSGERLKALEEISSMQNGVIITNAESAMSPAMLQAIDGLEIKMLVIDEAHLTLQWGLSFRPSLLRAIQLRKFLDDPLCAAFTATISESDRELLGKLLWEDENWDYFGLLSDRPNIHYRILPSVEPLCALRILLRSALDSSFNPFFFAPDLFSSVQLPLIVFIQNRQGCETAAMDCRIWLRLWKRDDVKVWHYHAGLDKTRRKQIEILFAGHQKGIIFTTKAFGTGVDIASVRTCIHIEEPETFEDFLQESGRGGRDGAPAFSIILRSKAKLFTQNSCRRRTALASLGQELEYCNGCDSCDNKILGTPVESLALEGIRLINRLKLDEREEYRLLKKEDFASLGPAQFKRVLDAEVRAGTH